MSCFRISSRNLNGARNVEKRTMYYNLLKQNTLILLLFKKLSNIDNEVEWKREWDGDIVLSHLSNVSAGVGILC